MCLDIGEGEAYIFLQYLVGQIYHLESGEVQKISLHTVLEQSKKPLKIRNLQ